MRDTKWEKWQPGKQMEEWWINRARAKLRALNCFSSDCKNIWPHLRSPIIKNMSVKFKRCWKELHLLWWSHIDKCIPSLSTWRGTFLIIMKCRLTLHFTSHLPACLVSCKRRLTDNRWTDSHSCGRETFIIIALFECACVCDDQWVWQP